MVIFNYYHMRFEMKHWIIGAQSLVHCCMSEFEDIRPYHDEEVTDALVKLVVDPEFTELVFPKHSVCCNIPVSQTRHPGNR
jgi:hypothetical protein